MRNGRIVAGIPASGTAPGLDFAKRITPWAGLPGFGRG